MTGRKAKRQIRKCVGLVVPYDSIARVLSKDFWIFERPDVFCYYLGIPPNSSTFLYFLQLVDYPIWYEMPENNDIYQFIYDQR